MNPDLLERSSRSQGRREGIAKSDKLNKNDKTIIMRANRFKEEINQTEIIKITDLESITMMTTTEITLETVAESEEDKEEGVELLNITEMILLSIKASEEDEEDTKEINKNSLVEEKWESTKEAQPEAEEEGDSRKKMRNSTITELTEEVSLKEV